MAWSGNGNRKTGKLLLLSLWISVLLGTSRLIVSIVRRCTSLVFWIRSVVENVEFCLSGASEEQGTSGWASYDLSSVGVAKLPFTTMFFRTEYRMLLFLKRETMPHTLRVLRCEAKTMLGTVAVLQWQLIIIVGQRSAPAKLNVYLAHSTLARYDQCVRHSSRDCQDWPIGL